MEEVLERTANGGWWNLDDLHCELRGTGLLGRVQYITNALVLTVGEKVRCAKCDAWFHRFEALSSFDISATSC